MVGENVGHAPHKQTINCATVRTDIYSSVSLFRALIIPCEKCGCCFQLIGIFNSMLRPSTGGFSLETGGGAAVFGRHP